MILLKQLSDSIYHKAYIMTTKTKFFLWFITLTGSVIWAWFFALPYIMGQTGIIPSIGILLGIGIMIMILHLILAEVSLSLPGHKTFVWLWRALLPHWLAQATSYIVIIHFFIWLLAYTILWGTFLQTLLADIGISIAHVRTVLIYTIIMAIFTWQWLKQSRKSWIIITVVWLICIWLVIIAWLSMWNTTLPTPIFTWSNGFALYGIALFAMSSIGTIPLLYEVAGNSAITMRSVIIASWAFVTLCCIMFWIAVLSISWSHTTPDSIQWLYTMGWKYIWFIWSILWCCAIMSCHTPMASHLKEIFSRDQKIPPLLSWQIITLLPLLFYLYFDPSIIKILSSTWGILGWLLIILVSIMNIRLHSTKQKVKIISMISYDQVRSRLLFLISGIGVLYHIFHLL